MKGKGGNYEESKLKVEDKNVKKNKKRERERKRKSSSRTNSLYKDAKQFLKVY